MKNSKKLIKLLKTKRNLYKCWSWSEKFGWIEDYSKKEESELKRYTKFLNSRRFDELQDVKVKTYNGDSQY